MDKVIFTADNSATLYSDKFEEHYHNTNGALTEALHIYINLGFKSFCNQNVNILEVGYGTGLNAVLTYLENANLKNKVFYHGIDKYPISSEIFLKLSYHKIFNLEEKSLLPFCENWNVKNEVDENFSLLKEIGDYTAFNPILKYDLIYFDAFSPESQPEMWSYENLKKILTNLSTGGVFVTYCCKGVVKQYLRDLGMNVKRFPGPLGKRHVIRATKI